AVDVDQRLIAHRDADVAAESNHRAAARAGRALRNGHARRATLEQLTDVALRLGELARIDLTDGVADFALTRGASRSGDNDFVECDHLLPEYEVLRDGSSRGDVHGILDRAMSDHLC